MLWRGPMGGGAASGRIGAMIASHCAQGQYLKSRVKCVNPRTFQQHPTRNAIRQLAVLWQEALTDDQRAAWNTYAANVTWLNRLGDTVHLSGQMEFIRSNANRLAFAGYYLPDAPTTFNRGDIGPAGTLSMGIGEALFTLTVDPAVPWLDGQITTVTYLWLGIPRSAGLGFIPRRTRFVDIIPGTAAGGVHVFGFGNWPPPAPGQTWALWYSANFSDGRLTTPIRTNTVSFLPLRQVSWTDSFPYPNGPLTGNGDWLTAPGMIVSTTVSSNTLDTSDAGGAANTISNDQLPTLTNRPFEFEFDFTSPTLGPTNADAITMALRNSADLTQAAQITLAFQPGDYALNQCSDIYLSTGLVDLIHLTNVPMTSGVLHTLGWNFDGLNAHLTLDGAPLDSAPYTSTDTFDEAFIWLQTSDAAPHTIVSRMHAEGWAA